MVSDIPKETLIAIANDTYDITHDLSIIPKNMAEIVDLLIEMADKLNKEQMPMERIPYESIFRCIMNNVIKSMMVICILFNLLMVQFKIFFHIFAIKHRQKKMCRKHFKYLYLYWYCHCSKKLITNCLKWKK